MMFSFVWSEFCFMRGIRTSFLGSFYVVVDGWRIPRRRVCLCCQQWGAGLEKQILVKITRNKSDGLTSVLTKRVIGSQRDEAAGGRTLLQLLGQANVPVPANDEV